MKNWELRERKKAREYEKEREREEERKAEEVNIHNIITEDQLCHSEDRYQMTRCHRNEMTYADLLILPLKRHIALSCAFDICNVTSK